MKRGVAPFIFSVAAGRRQVHGMLATSPGTVIAGVLAEPPQADPQSFLDSLFLKANSAAR